MCRLCHMGAGRGRKCLLPSQKAVAEVLDGLIGVLFPGCHGICPLEFGRSRSALRDQLRQVALTLEQQVAQALRYQCQVDNCDNCEDCAERARQAVRHVIDSLSAVQHTLQLDIRAAYEGDPAARSPMEIVLSYPCLQAIAAYRLAHLLYEKEVPLIPRVMTELAHSRTGIDIHPGAKIGPGFFIDHGTGVVIGETCVIGRNVKLYQGVTLGALSFPKDEHGHPIKGIQRHPRVGDNVTIYAEATILGGDTHIGDGAEIGGNVWLTHSVPPNSKVYNVQPDLKVKKGRGKSPP
ncbi:MAG: serine acetyltransferase [Kiritimatiellae bacterium]|nr:serine acetyltransferase [Kiritimatiellia bacterium]